MLVKNMSVTFPVRVALCFLLLIVAHVAMAEVISARTVSSSEVFEDQGRSVIVSTDAPSELFGLYWLKPDPTEFLTKLERRVTLRSDGTAVTEAVGVGGGLRAATWGLRTANDKLMVTRYPGPVWMGSHEGENLRAYTLVLRYKNGDIEEKLLFESRDRLAIDGPAGIALLKQR